MVEFTTRFSKLLKYFDILKLSRPSNAAQRKYYKKALPEKWQEYLEISGKDFSSFLYIQNYIFRFERREKNQPQQASKKSNNHKQNGNNKKNNKKQQNDSSKKWCSFHKTNSHNTDECRSKKKEDNQNQGQSTGKKQVFTKGDWWMKWKMD